MLTECGCATKLDAISLGQMLVDAGFPDQHAHQPADAAAVNSPSATLVVTTDGGSPVFPDPETAGEVAFKHAASDLYARGATPAFATVFMSAVSNSRRELLSGFLAGIRKAGEAVGCAIINGHTSIGEGSTFRYAISLIGSPIGGRLLDKSGATAGDRLYLSKAIAGTTALKGMVLGHLDESQRASLRRELLTSNEAASRAVTDIPVHACTDITGFGLLGSLVEMLPMAGAKLDEGAIPFWPGLRRLFPKVDPANGAKHNFAYAERNHRVTIRDPFVKAMTCDPVTSGPLLLAAPPPADTALRAAGFVRVGIVTTERAIIIE
jgi:selenide,water dikinase